MTTPREKALEALKATNYTASEDSHNAKMVRQAIAALESQPPESAATEGVVELRENVHEALAGYFSDENGNGEGCPADPSSLPHMVESVMRLVAGSPLEAEQAFSKVWPSEKWGGADGISWKDFGLAMFREGFIARRLSESHPMVSREAIENRIIQWCAEQDCIVGGIPELATYLESLQLPTPSAPSSNGVDEAVKALESLATMAEKGIVGAYLADFPGLVGRRIRQALAKLGAH